MGAMAVEGMMADERESTGQRCPACGRYFLVLADEEGQHACPSCGYSPYREDDDEDNLDDYLDDPYNGGDDDD